MKHFVEEIFTEQFCNKLCAYENTKEKYFGKYSKSFCIKFNSLYFQLFNYKQLPNNYTERKTDPKFRYFPMFKSTFAKCLIQLSVELIQPDIPCVIQ